MLCSVVYLSLRLPVCTRVSMFYAGIRKKGRLKDKKSEKKPVFLLFFWLFVTLSTCEQQHFLTFCFLSRNQAVICLKTFMPTLLNHYSVFLSAKLSLPAHLSVSLSVCLSFCLPICLLVHLSAWLFLGIPVRLLTVSLFTCSPVCLSVRLSTCMFLCQPVCLSPCSHVSQFVCLHVPLSACLSASKFIGLPACLPECSSVWQSVWLPVPLSSFLQACMFFGVLVLMSAYLSACLFLCLSVWPNVPHLVVMYVGQILSAA